MPPNIFSAKRGSAKGQAGKGQRTVMETRSALGARTKKQPTGKRQGMRK